MSWNVEGWMKKEWAAFIVSALSREIVVYPQLLYLQGSFPDMDSTLPNEIAEQTQYKDIYLSLDMFQINMHPSFQV